MHKKTHKGKMKGKYYSGQAGHGQKESKSLSQLNKGDLKSTSLSQLNRGDLKSSFDVQNNVKGMSLDMGGASGYGFGGKMKGKKHGY